MEDGPVLGPSVAADRMCRTSALAPPPNTLSLTTTRSPGAGPFGCGRDLILPASGPARAVRGEPQRLHS